MKDHLRDLAKAMVVRCREAWAALMRGRRAGLAAMEPEIDRLVRFADRFETLLPKR